MKRITLSLVLFVVGAPFPNAAPSAPAPSPAESPSGLFARGLRAEEVERDLPAAIAAYQELIRAYDAQRAAAANALLRLAECYRKQGQTNDAVAGYQRVLTDFADHPALADTSRKRLLMLRVEPAGGSALTPAGQEQVQLLRQELALVEKQIESKELQLDAGVLSPDDLIPLRRDALALRRQILEVEAKSMRRDLLGTMIPTAAEDAGGPAEPDADPGEAAELERLRSVLRTSPDLIHSRDSAGLTMLSRAVRRGQQAVAQFLLDQGAAIEARSGTGNTPLHYAALQGNRGMVQFLLDHQAPVNARNATGGTPLLLAALQGYLGVVDALLAAGADVNLVATPGKLEKTDALTGNDVSLVWGSGTALHHAAGEGHLDVVKRLLAAGTDVNVGKATDFGTPLCRAVVDHQVEVVRVLLEAGADPNAGINEGLPLHLAVRGGKSDSEALIRLLAQHGADVNAKDSQGNTPLHWAVRGGQLSSLAALLERGANPNLRNEAMQPPLLGLSFNASAVGLMKPIADQLLQHGADVNTTDSEGTTALLLAAAHRNRPLVQLFLEKGAQVNPTNSANLTPLGVLNRQLGSPVVGLDGVGRTSNSDAEVAIRALLLEHGAK